MYSIIPILYKLPEGRLNTWGEGSINTYFNLILVAGHAKYFRGSEGDEENCLSDDMMTATDCLSTLNPSYLCILYFRPTSIHCIIL